MKLEDTNRKKLKDEKPWQDMGLMPLYKQEWPQSPRQRKK